MKKKKSGQFSDSSPVMLHGQAVFLSRHGAVWFFGNGLAATLFTLLHWVGQEGAWGLLVLWFAALVVVGGMRWGLGQQWLAAKSASQGSGGAQVFAQRYLFYSTVISALWGMSGLLLFSTETMMQAVHIVLLAAVVITVLPVLALSRLAMYVQIGVVLFPAVLHLLLMGGYVAQVLAGATVLLAVLLGLAARFVAHLMDDLHQAKLQMQEQAHTDPVTQIPNRRFFDTIFKTEWRRAMRNGGALSLLMIDVDHFKRYNDRHGHHAGDQCLLVIAQCIKAVARRASDVVARHGGEEFVILLPDTGLDDAVRLAERLRKGVEDRCIPHEDGANPRIVTVSVGVASCSPAVFTDAQQESAVLYPAMLLNSADRALYRAKRNGRNQVAKEQCLQAVVALPVAAPVPSTVSHAA